jgi:hypothetical protein
MLGWTRKETRYFRAYGEEYEEDCLPNVQLRLAQKGFHLVGCMVKNLALSLFSC